METIELHLDEQTAERLRRLANARRVTLEELLQETVAHLGQLQKETIHFGDCLPRMLELLDEVVEGAMQAREERPLRAPRG